MMLKAVKTRTRQRIQDFMRESSPPNPVNFASRNSRKGTLDDLSKRTGKVLATLTPREEIVLRWRFGIGSDASCTPREPQPEVLSDAQPGPRNPTEGLCQAAQGFGLFRKTLTGNGRPTQFEGSLTPRRLRRARRTRA